MIKIPNVYKIFGEITIFYIKDKEILIDTENLESLIKHRWFLSKSNKHKDYVRVMCNISSKKIRLHRFILNITDSKIEIDHINRNPLDNRKCNLRIVTKSQNGFNREMRKTNKSGYRGIWWDKSRNKWFVSLRIDGKLKGLGRYSNLDEAIKVRNKVFLEIHGDFFVFDEKDKK